jgi:uncharacterized membrane protein YoaK (UPF0700 family)
MFRHQGKSRTLNHNQKIASLLSFVAGVVNVAGFIAIQKLTTNVTGHFAYFVDEVFKLNFSESATYFFYIFFFFLGAFVSSLLVELVTRSSDRYIFIIPIMMESFILLFLSLFGQTLLYNHANIIAFSLLFAMGLQNSLVTRISDAIVRTTHLTGLFTDLGIELAQLFFYKERAQKYKLVSTIKLRLRIITFFFSGGIIGGVFYSYFNLSVLILPASLLIIGLMYDGAKFKIINWKRKNVTKENFH